jgi:hypothetical protein
MQNNQLFVIVLLIVAVLIGRYSAPTAPPAPTASINDRAASPDAADEQLSLKLSASGMNSLMDWYLENKAECDEMEEADESITIGESAIRLLLKREKSRNSNGFFSPSP